MIYHPLGGFTIVELLVVVIVIALLAAVTSTSYAGWQRDAATTELQSELKTFRSNIQQEQNFQSTATYGSTALPTHRNITFSGGVTDSGTRYCYLGVNKKDTTIRLYISSLSDQITATKPYTGCPN